MFNDGSVTPDRLVGASDRHLSYQGVISARNPQSVTNKPAQVTQTNPCHSNTRLCDFWVLASDSRLHMYFLRKRTYMLIGPFVRGIGNINLSADENR